MTRQNHPNNLQYYRLKRKLTQQQVADHIGHKSANRLSSWEHGTTKPGLSNLFKLSVLYKEPIEHLYAGLSKAIVRKETSSRIQAPAVSLGEHYGAMTTEEQVAVFAEMIVTAFFAERAEKTRKPTSHL